MLAFRYTNMEYNMAKNIGAVMALFVSQNNIKKRTEKTILNLDKKGIISDKYYNSDIQRSVLIASIQSYTLAETHNIKMPYGSLGENLLIDYNPYNLTPGTRLQIGGTLLEISQYCTMCNHLSNIDTQLPTLLKYDRGIFAKVITGGQIKIGDTIIR